MGTYIDDERQSPRPPGPRPNRAPPVVRCSLPVCALLLNFLLFHCARRQPPPHRLPPPFTSAPSVVNQLPHVAALEFIPTTPA